MEDFLRYLYGAMARDAIWQYASEDQLQDAQMAIERSVMNRIFKLAFYPNQDGDILRDQWVAPMRPLSFNNIFLFSYFPSFKTFGIGQTWALNTKVIGFSGVIEALVHLFE